MSNLSVKALVEIRDLTTKAQSLARGTSADRKEADVLLARVSAIRQAGISTDEARMQYVNGLAAEMGMPEVDFEKAREQRKIETVFRKFLRGLGEAELQTELRGDMAAGTSTSIFTAGPEGGFLVPQSFYRGVVEGLRQLTPLLDPEVVTYVETPTGAPLPVPGWDLTIISASKIAENTKQEKGTPPTATTRNLGAFSYRTDPIAVSMELETDSFESIINLLTEAFTIGFHRGIGADLANGDGVTGPQGIVAGAQPSGMTTALPNVITADELLTVFHAVNRVHRANPKCAWVMSDIQWETIRKTAASLGGTTNSAWRFMLDETEDDELLGKPVFIDPNLGATLPSSTLIFGNLSRFFVRCGGGLRIRRNIESPYIERGQFLYTAMMRVDSAVIAPGNDIPIVYGRFSS